MIMEIFANLTRAILYIIVLTVFTERKKYEIFKWKCLISVVVITSLQLIAVMNDNKAFSKALPFFVMMCLAILQISYTMLKDMVGICIVVMKAYAFVFILSVGCGVICGGIASLLYEYWYISDLYIVITLVRTIFIILIWFNYEKIQKYNNNKISYIMFILGSFALFFQQMFELAYSTKNYSFANIVVLLLYLTMIFTAFMLLQHNRLTAKQQAIEEDNRQMSQRLHRSKDVLGVVSQVVASEDHIDPKLRKELADFCDDEMNEMQDRALGANLIGDTGIELVNVMLQKQMMRCADLNISFDVMIPAPIDGYIREIGISVTEFMRMLNDLLKNAVKAILSSDNTHRELLLIMGEAGNDCFEIRLYDSGVPFPPKILEHLGERGNTTDGTGNGIADTVETLRRYRASFVIEPIEPGTDIYTKCIHIAFDEQGCLPQNGEQ